MNTTHAMARLFTSPVYLSQQLKRQYQMPESRIQDALEGQDPVALKIINDYLVSELEREDYGIYIKTLRCASGTASGDLAAGIARTSVTLSNYESGRVKPPFDALKLVIEHIAPPDRVRQLRDVALEGNFPVYLDVLHAVYN